MRKIKRISALVTAVLLALSVVSLTGCKKNEDSQSPYMTAVNNLALAYNGDVKILDQLAPQDAWNYLRRDGFSPAEHQERIQNKQSLFLKDIHFLYGNDAYLTISVSNVSACDQETLENIGKGLNRVYGLKKNNITAAYKMERTINIVASEEHIYESMPMYAVEIQGNWYLVYNHSEEEQPIFYFPFLNNKDISLSS